MTKRMRNRDTASTAKNWSAEHTTNTMRFTVYIPLRPSRSVSGPKIRPPRNMPISAEAPMSPSPSEPIPRSVAIVGSATAMMPRR